MTDPATTATPSPGSAAAPQPALGMDSQVPAWVGVALCLLLAIAQIAFAGYQLGAGNQPIQIAFLKHAADPSLFSSDEMLRQTMPLYPTYFFRLLAPLVSVAGLEPLYFMLHLLTSFFTLCSVYLLGRSIFKSHTAAIVAAALLVAGHHRALAGEWLYTAWFTHTLAALPLALVALALAYRRRMFWAFAIAGILFNLHALTAAYAILMMCFAMLADLQLPWIKPAMASPVPLPQDPGLKPQLSLANWLLRFLACGTIAALLAAPTLLQMLHARNGQLFDAGWVNLMRVRSADHSFPSTWWATGNSDIPRIALLFALFVLSWSFSPVRRPDTARALRVTVLMTISVALLFAVGYVFSEIHPVPLFIRLQPFRASRLLMVLMLVHIAYGAVEGIRSGITGRALTRDGSSLALSRISRIAEFLTGILILATLGIGKGADPGLLQLLPLTLLAALITALISSRLSITQALVAVAALSVAIIAHHEIGFSIPLLSPNLALLPRQWPDNPLVPMMLLSAILGAAVIALYKKPLPRLIITGVLLVIGSCGAYELFTKNGMPGTAAHSSPLANVSNWAQTKTPKTALFLAPSGLSNFRIFASRSLVADWRDGTQLYFSANFGPEWLQRLSAIEPGLLLSPDGSRLVARGRSLDTVDDDELLALAGKYKATYILLPTPPKTHPRTLQIAFADSHFTAYLPKISPSEAALPPGVINPAEWSAMEKFMATTVASNIEKYRKADITIQIVDPTGRPVQDLPATLEQTAHAFLFGSSLSFFEPNTVDPLGDQKAPPVTDAELKLFPTLFNASMIPFVGKWLYIEPTDGQRNFSDLDKYLDYCQKNHVAVEYHFLTGLLPRFLRKNQAEAAKRLPEHAMEIVDRYHDKVAFWQVFNDRILMNSAPPLIKQLREKYPGIKLGISDCMRFFSDRKDAAGREHEMYKGWEGLVYLKSQGATPDFFSMHGHYPIGLWADPRTMYEVFDRFQKENVKVHVSEMFLPLGSNVAGPVRKGKWTPELQADYFERFLTVCFSHPNVELVNLWGMPSHGWGGSSGLLDDKLNPRPSFERLQKLFHETWHTHVETHLPLDGILSTRAFHGSYQLTLQLPGGRTATTALILPQLPTAAYKFQLNPATATLTLISQPIPPATKPATATTQTSTRP